jgi:hypothetical protein
LPAWKARTVQWVCSVGRIAAPVIFLGDELLALTA